MVSSFSILLFSAIVYIVSEKKVIINNRERTRNLNNAIKYSTSIAVKEGKLNVIFQHLKLSLNSIGNGKRRKSKRGKTVNNCNIWFLGTWSQQLC